MTQMPNTSTVWLQSLASQGQRRWVEEPKITLMPWLTKNEAHREASKKTSKYITIFLIQTQVGSATVESCQSETA